MRKSGLPGAGACRCVLESALTCPSPLPPPTLRLLRSYVSKVTLHCPSMVQSRVDDSTLFSYL